MSAIPDSADTSIVRPSNWNAEHTLTMATNRLLGRATASTGPVEELTPTQARALLELVIGTNLREVLTANRTYYIRPDGSDSNNGLSNTSGGAFLTYQRAIDVVAALDISIYNVQIQVADGTYTAGATINGPWVGVGTVTLVGNTGTPANVIQSVASGNCISCFNGGKITVSGFEPRAAGGACLFVRGGGSVITIGPSMRFGASGNQHMFAEDGGSFFGRDNYSIVGSVQDHISIGAHGRTNIFLSTLTLTGTPAFSGAFFRATQLSNGFYVPGTLSGSATGQRYHLTSNSVLTTNGSGPTGLPGNAGGYVEAGSIYQ